MGLKPSDAFVGVIELFAVLLPGTLLTAALVIAGNARTPDVLRPLLATDGAQWVAFVVCAYALGHFVFLLASPMDELVYEHYRLFRERKWRDIAKQDPQIGAKPVRRRGVRWDTRAFDLVSDLRDQHFPGVESARMPMGNYSWAKAMLMIGAQAALADVQRYEADSKFFRSLVIVLPFAATLIAWHLWPDPLAFGLIGCSLLLAAICWIRYAERRHKSTEWAFYYVLVLSRDSKLA